MILQQYGLLVYLGELFLGFLLNAISDMPEKFKDNLAKTIVGIIIFLWAFSMGMLLMTDPIVLFQGVFFGLFFGGIFWAALRMGEISARK